MNFLKIVPLLSELPHSILAKIADVLEPEVFTSGDYIVREGTPGDTFYILATGEVRVTKRSEGVEETIRDLTKGEYFGEQVTFQLFISELIRKFYYLNARPS